MNISDFTIRKYRLLCEVLSSLPCRVLTVKQFIETGNKNCMAIIMRHDVDRSFLHAVRMAKIEAAWGLQSSYYVRMTPNVYVPMKIRLLKKLGHEVGYHYEVLTKAGGDLCVAANLFDCELKTLRSFVAIDTVSMHGSPLSRWNNLDIWKKIACEDYGLTGDASISIDYQDIYYFTDTGRSWNADVYNIRDRVASKNPPSSIHTTNDLIRFIKSEPESPVFINSHPNRWSGNFFDHSVCVASDTAANWLKWVIRKWHARKRFL